MNYKKLAKKYKPQKINTLLVGEAPPQNGKTYFYLPEDDVKHSSLPGSVFIHYFNRLPNDKIEYQDFLDVLKNWGIWVIDIEKRPVKVWIDRKNWIKDHKVIIKIAKKIPKLKRRIRRLKVNETDVIFLLARKDYKRTIKRIFPNSKYFSWKEFKEQ